MLLIYFYVSPIVCGFCVGICFDVDYFGLFLVCNHHDEEERAGCLALFICLTVNFLCLFLMVPWLDLHFVIVV